MAQDLLMDGVLCMGVQGICPLDVYVGESVKRRPCLVEAANYSGGDRRVKFCTLEDRRPFEVMSLADGQKKSIITFEPVVVTVQELCDTIDLLEERNINSELAEVVESMVKEGCAPPEVVVAEKRFVVLNHNPDFNAALKAARKAAVKAGLRQPRIVMSEGGLYTL